MKKLLSLALCLLMLMPGIVLADETPVTWSGTISVAPGMFGPFDESKDVAVGYAEEYLKENYGLDVDFEVVYVENSNYTEIINTRIAGGNAPDIFRASGATYLEKYYEQGAIASWDLEFFKENAPNVYAYLNGGGYQGRMAEFVPLVWDYACMEDGKMVCVPYFDEQNMMPAKTMIYRKDWLDALGVTEEQLPTTLDDFVALMYRFANEDPDGNGVKDTYGCSQSAIRAIFGAYGSSYDTTLWLEDDEGKLISTDIMPANKSALELLAKMYADGVLDPEFVTGENNGGYWAVNHAFINGVIGASCHASIDHYRRPEILNDKGGPVAIEYYAINGSDAEFTYGPWPAGPEGEYGLEIGCPVDLVSAYVYDARLNEDPEKLAAIFKIMDIFSTDDQLMERCFWGIKDEHFAVDENGVYKSLGYGYTAASNEVGIMALRGVYGPDKVYSERCQYLAFYGEPTIKNRLDFFENPQCDMYRQTKLTTILPSESTYNAELATLRSETFANIITGVASIDTYDAYVEEWMEIGGSTLMQEANEWYASTK